MAAATISVEQLGKRYNSTPVLEAIDLEIDAGEMVAVMGRSGSGKSTLLRLLGALDTPDTGTIRHDTTDISTLDDSALSRFRRSRLGFVFQFFSLIPTLSVQDNIAMPLALNGIQDQDANNRVLALMDALEISGKQSRMPDELSGGEQQRVAIARALVHNPGVVIADEPTGNLDSATASRILSLLRDACRAGPATLIIATHSNSAALASDRTVRIHDGRVVAD